MKNSLITHQGLLFAKNGFVAEVTFKFSLECLLSSSLLIPLENIMKSKGALGRNALTYFMPLISFYNP